MLYRLLFFIIFLIFLLIIRFYQSTPKYKENDQIKITASITEMPTVTINSFGTAQQKFKLLGITVYAPLYPSFRYGDRLEATGQVQKGKSGYWLKTAKEINLLPPHPLLSPLGRFRNRLESLLRTYLPEPHSSLLAGMVLGSKNLPSDFYQKLQNSGTLHVVVASGANIALLVAPLMEIFLLVFSRRLAAVFLIFIIWFYALLTGFEPPILRASLMASFSFLALLLGRRTLAWWSLILSVFFLLLINPQYIFDIGFQLSFLATAGILWFSPPLKKLFRFLPVIIHESWCMTLSAQIATLPVLLFTFHRFQPLSPFVNAALLWTVPWITSLGMVSLFLGLIWYPLGQGIAYLIYPLSSIFIFVTGIF